ncbi:helicase Mov10l1 [Lecanosticta acicola]|uniref:Helicase Mov10l1 n=1 Tax=Lecanosticta acicola TaxID=111012 RepID=A0AAI8W0L1_9PEZI|nr:helicase Mov10l1 [Lecanosticta acicola]
MTERILDPYARPYIPLDLVRANHAPAIVLPSAPAASINYEAYINLFVADNFRADTRVSAYYHAAKDSAPTNTSEQPETISAASLPAYFASALTREAAALQKHCDEHALYNVVLVRSPSEATPFVYQLSVPGLREPSLSIEIGDVVCVRQLVFAPTGKIAFTSPSSPYPIYGQHNAVVWGVNRQNETLSLRIDWLEPGSGRFNICFTVQKLRLDAMRGAIADAAGELHSLNAWFHSMTFPDPAHGILQYDLKRGDSPLDLHDEELNYEQLKAVQAVLRQDYGPVPYLVTGPPGTGKTKTVVETALQILSNDDKPALLLCAPSDPACDTLVQRLSKHLNPQRLLRLNAPSRSFPEVPNTVLPFCHVEGAAFSLPPFTAFMKKQVVVVTCRDAVMLLKACLSNRDLCTLELGLWTAFHPHATSRIPPLHWTGLIMDEAAQATEPESMLPLLVVAPPQTTVSDLKRPPFVLMVGDQHQLGPRTASKEPEMQQSMFERLLRLSLYQDHPLARSRHSGGTIRPLTKDMLPVIRPPFADLIRNYRSHPAIIATPSSLFYHDTLEPTATSTDSLLQWHAFGKRKFPLLFANNSSRDEIEQDGGGWFNIGEADIALRYAMSFARERCLAPHEICIMSPFRAQVNVLRLKARSPEYKLSGVNIGPLEAFQGLESRLFILCTTRARDRFVDQDIARGLGIIFEPRRFNMALTRAKEGLIVIGNPEVLMQDENWASFMAFCHRNGAWEGPTHDLHWPHSSKIKMSRLEKQLAYREKLEEDEARLDKVARKLGHLKLGMSEEEAFYESGIHAQLAVGLPEEVERLETQDGSSDNEEVHSST